MANSKWRVGTALGALALMVPGARAADATAKQFDWFGELRLRGVLVNVAQTKPATDKAVRVKALVGAKGDLADGKVGWGVNICTMPTGKKGITARLDTFGGGNFNGSNSVGFDQLYVALRPTKRTTVTLGKQRNPFWESDGMFDLDLTPEGVVLQNDLSSSKAGGLLTNVGNTLAFLPVAFPKGVNDSPFLVADQLRMRVGAVNTGVGVYYYSGLKQAPTGYNGTYTKNNMTVVSARASYQLPGLKRCPLALTGEVFNNFGSKSKSLGLEGRLDLLKLGAGSASVTYRAVQRSATFDAWVDDDFGEHAGYQNGIKVEYLRPLSKGLNLRAVVFHTQPLQGSLVKRTDRLYVDVIHKF